MQVPSHVARLTECRALPRAWAFTPATDPWCPCYPKAPRPEVSPPPPPNLLNPLPTAPSAASVPPLPHSIETTKVPWVVLGSISLFGPFWGELGGTTPASTTRQGAPPVEVRTAPAETMKVRAMPACATRRDGVHGARAPGSAGMQGGGRPAQHAEGWGNRASRTRKRGEACGGRPGCGEEWAAKTVKRPLQQPAQPPVRQLLGPANNTTTNTGRSGRQQALTRLSAQREGRVTVQGSVKKAATRWNATPAGGGGGGGAVPRGATASQVVMREACREWLESRYSCFPEYRGTLPNHWYRECVDGVGGGMGRDTGSHGHRVLRPRLRSERTSTGSTAQGPVKKPQPDGMSHGREARQAPPPPPKD